MSAPRVIADAAGFAAAFDRIERAVRAEFPADIPLAIIGVRSRGEHLAKRLAGNLRAAGRRNIDSGTLDITWYRDDLSGRGAHTLVRPTEIDFSLDDKPVVLVDDVLFTGRSVRAALDALMDFGRPRCIRLAVMADRGGRELPIQPDYRGLEVAARADEKVEVRLAETDGADLITVVG